MMAPENGEVTGADFEDDAGDQGNQGAGETTQEEQSGTGDVNRGTNKSATKRASGQAPKPAPAKTPAKGMPKLTKIILEENDNIPPTGQYFGHNGKGYIHRAGEVAAVPPGIISILNDAIMATAIRDPQTQKVIGHRDKLRYPYRVVPDNE